MTSCCQKADVPDRQNIHRHLTCWEASALEEVLMWQRKEEEAGQCVVEDLRSCDVGGQSYLGEEQE